MDLRVQASSRRDGVEMFMADDIRRPRTLHIRIAALVVRPEYYSSLCAILKRLKWSASASTVYGLISGPDDHASSSLNSDIRKV